MSNVVIIKESTNVYKAAALVAVSMLSNRKVYDRHATQVPKLIENIKSWDDLDPYNVHIDEDGVKNTLMVKCIDIVLTNSGTNPTDASDQIESNVRSIFGAIGLPVKYLHGTSDFVTCIGTIKNIKADGTFAVGTGKKQSRIGLVGDDTSPFAIHMKCRRHVRKLGQMQYLVGIAQSVELLSTIVIDTDKIFKCTTYDRIDVGDVSKYSVYDRIVHPKYPHRTHELESSVIDYRQTHIPYIRLAPGTLDNVAYIHWNSITPIPVDPTQYESINSLLSIKDDAKTHIKMMREMSPTNQSDICVKCKTPLHCDIYVLESETRHHICVCALCVHTSDILSMINTDIKYKVLRTTYPRLLSEFINCLDNPPIYNEYLKLRHMRISNRDIEKKLQIQIADAPRGYYDNGNDIIEKIMSIPPGDTPVIILM